MSLGDYIRQTWQNAVTAINATRLNNIETGVDAVTDAVRRMQERVIDPAAYGVVGDGIVDDTAALQAAENARQAVNGVLEFGPDMVVKVTSQIDVGDRCAWRGIRTERGANAIGMLPDGYTTARINWRPADPNTNFIQEIRLTNDGSVYGPYHFENIYFDFQISQFVGANGIELGRDASDTAQPANPTKVLFGVKFQSCNFQGAENSNKFAADGTVTRTGHRFISLGHHFESTIDDCSFTGHDIQIYSKGADAPSISHCRMQGGMVNIELGGGESAVGAAIEHVQMELWGIAAMNLYDSWVKASKVLMENEHSQYPNTGRLALPGTVAVTAGSDTLTFSQSMTNKLFPRVSLLEITDGVNTDTVQVKSVSGTTVVIESTCFEFDWSAAAATVVRIHGYGVISWGDQKTTLTDCSPGSENDTPWAVHVMGPGTKTAISNAIQGPGAYGNLKPIVIGNKLHATPHMDSGMYVASSDAFSSPNPAEPFVTVAGIRSRNGQEYDIGWRSATADLAQEEAVVRRRWIFSPKGHASTPNNNHEHLIKMLPGQTNTKEKIACWSVPAGRYHEMLDHSLPTTGYFRVMWRVRARSTSGTFSGGGHLLNVGSENWVNGEPITTTWKTFTRYVSNPTWWNTSRTPTSNVGMQYVSNVTVCVAAIVIEELIGPFHAGGIGSPEGVIPAPPGSTYGNESGGTGTTFYVKRTGTGNTGWFAVA